MENSIWQLIEDLKSKKGITDLAINGNRTVFAERQGRFYQLKVDLKEEDFIPFINEVAAFNKKKCDVENPILDGLLPDGSRINIISGPYSPDGPTITIRKYLHTIKSFDGNPGIFSLSPEWIMLFKAFIQARLNIMISGGTGSGKTTFLNLLLNEFPTTDRVVIIEDTQEINVSIPNVVRLISREFQGQVLTVRDLVKNSLRMRPDRLIIGEVRGGEFFDFLQAMNTGHEGSMSTIHANNPKECLTRMESLFLFSGEEIPLNALRKQIAQSVDFIIQIERNKKGERVVSNITEISGMEGGSILLNELAVYEDNGLKYTGMVPSCMEKIHQASGIGLDFFSVSI